MLRAAFGDGSAGPPLGWEKVRAFEAEHGIVLPEPYRTFVAETGDGSYTGPPGFGLLEPAELPRDWGDYGPERVLAEPFPLTAAGRPCFAGWVAHWHANKEWFDAA
ncbi:SMI1/KNR4 family protein [Streptomyces sp. NPDC015127]|uniref:SMI1/KNR4 family protein n=1 Tax=Streptomyces sp. NPDC015127 TaxID=3364939 RepID=UPI0036F5F492